MKAIYINLDPYLQAVADWLNAGKPGTVPSFQPLPVAVTIPLGESAAIYIEKAWSAEDEDFNPDILTIDGTTVGVRESIDENPGDEIAKDEVPGFSSVAPSAKYAVLPVSGNQTVVVTFSDGSDDLPVTLAIPVLVRRETASGPVDLVDFTPRAAAPSAAQINTALGGTGPDEGAPLAGVSLSRAKIITGDTALAQATLFSDTTDSASGTTFPVYSGNAVTVPLGGNGES